MRSIQCRTFALLVLSALTACVPDPVSSEFDVEVIEEVQFASSLAIDLADFIRLPSGVYIEDVTLGEGTGVAAGDRVDELHYTGWLHDGTEFDSGTAAFLMGGNDVIPGFEQGVVGMRAGGIRRMIIPPALGYGQSAAGSVPGGSVLVFRVELVSFSSFGG